MFFEKKKTFIKLYGDALESPWRKGWAQVADGWCSQAEMEDIQRYVWSNPSTVKQQVCFKAVGLHRHRSSSLCPVSKRPSPALLWFGEGRLPPAGQLVALQTQEEQRKRGKRKKGVERSCVHLVVLSVRWVTLSNMKHTNIKSYPCFHSNMRMTRRSTHSPANAHTHTHTHKLQLKGTYTLPRSSLGHVMDMRVYESEGRHEEQSGSGRQTSPT